MLKNKQAKSLDISVVRLYRPNIIHKLKHNLPRIFSPNLILHYTVASGFKKYTQTAKLLNSAYAL